MPILRCIPSIPKEKDMAKTHHGTTHLRYKPETGRKELPNHSCVGPQGEEETEDPRNFPLPRLGLTGLLPVRMGLGGTSG